MPSVGFFSKLAAKVLGFDQTRLPEQQYAIIQDLLARQAVQVKGRDATELLSSLKKKHYVNSITLFKKKQGAVFSSTGNGRTEAETGASLLNQVNSAFSNTDVVAFRTDKEWVMLMPSESSVYVIKANSALSPTEMKALIKEAEASLKKRHLN